MRGAGYRSSVFSGFPGFPGLPGLSKFPGFPRFPVAAVLWTASVPRPLGPGRKLVSQSTDCLGDTYWVQTTTAPAPSPGTRVTINDTAPRHDMWNLALIEIT